MKQKHINTTTQKKIYVYIYASPTQANFYSYFK